MASRTHVPKALFELSALLLFSVAGCGDEQAPRDEEEEEEMFVGVIPAGLGKENASCPMTPYASSILFEMDDEDTTKCSYESGDLGEGTWVAPDVVKRAVPFPCIPAERSHTPLEFCRVAITADAFRPLTADSGRTQDFYAVLMLSSACPAGSTRIMKRIYNEDQQNENRFHGAVGAQGQNEITTGARGSQTTLNFCYFRAASSDTETMTEFPDLGFHYGVFHDFDIAQPGWVLAKRWQLSDDSNNNSRDKNYYTPASSAAAQEFMQIIENPVRDQRTDTCFDMAQVR